MHLKDHDLRQIDEKRIGSLSAPQLRPLALKLLQDLKEARERLHENPTNSSCPPSNRPPWDNSDSDSEELFDEEEEEEEEVETEIEPEEAEKKAGKNPGHDSEGLDESDGESPKSASRPARKPGKPKGAQGYGRTQKMAITDTKDHFPQRCALCDASLNEIRSKAWTGYDVIDIAFGDLSHPGIHTTATRHRHYQSICICGHTTRHLPHREAPGAEDWEQVALTEWRLVGPTLCALIIALTYRHRMSRARTQEFLSEWLGIQISTGTLQNCLQEAGRAVAPVEDQLVEELARSHLLHADETPHKEHGKLLWLWAFVTSETALFLIGRREKEMFENVFAELQNPWLMSDGYRAYRSYQKRLRCWAHLQRKAKALEESLHRPMQRIGLEITTALKTLMKSIYQAREGPKQEKSNLMEKHQVLLDRLRRLCVTSQSSRHKKTRALGTEFLLDWDAIFRVLEHPELPLTNNAAEQALRHWVILRRVTYGTRSPLGSRTYALLASVIDTCRRRNVSPWPYLAAVIQERRQGHPAPLLPVPIAIS